MPLDLSIADLTGTHADTLLVTAVNRCLKQDFIYTIRPRTQSTRLAEGDDWELRLAANPFRPAEANRNPGVKVRAELERADYGPASNFEDALTGYAFLGLVGAAIVSQSGKNAYVVALQARVVAEVDGVEIPMLVRVAQAVDVRVTSRREAIRAASEAAHGSFLLDLAQEISKRGIVTSEQHRYEYSTLEALQEDLSKRLTGSNDAAP